MPTPLRPLERLALGLQCRRHHDLGLLELLQRLVAARGHRGPQRAEQVHAAVVLVGRADQDLLERAPDLTCAPGRREAASGGTSPCPSGSPGRAPRPRRPAGEPIITASAPHTMALAMSPPGAHAAVGDDVHVDAGLVEVAHAGGPGVGDGGGLGHADAEHAPGRAGVAGADADQHADRARAHEVEGGLVAGAAADDDRHLELADDLEEVERLTVLGDVLGRHHRALDDEHVELAGDDGGQQLVGALRGDRRRRRPRRRRGSGGSASVTSSGLIGSR